MKTPHPAVLSRAMLFLILASLLFWVVVFLPIDNPGPPVVVYGSVVLGGLVWLPRLASGISNAGVYGWQWVSRSSVPSSG
jgi:hypothetical protein